MQYNKDAVGRVIREIRKEKGLSQDVVSGLANIGTPHLSRIESGKKQANLETVWKIAAALDMKPSELLARIEKES